MVEKFNINFLHLEQDISNLRNVTRTENVEAMLKADIVQKEQISKH